MILRDFKKKNILIFSIVIVILSSSIFFFSFKNNWNDYFEGTKFNHPKLPQLAAQETLTVVWLENPNFNDPIEPTWYPELAGDIDDVDATVGSGQVNLEVLGDVRTFNDIYGTPQAQDWTEFNHSIRPLPLTHEINQYGFNVSHVYYEGSGGDQTANLAGVLWKRNITMPVDMSDYNITSAFVSAIVNGSADQDIETINDLPIIGGYASLFDHSFFYVVISDLNNVEYEEIASFRTDILGEGRVGRTYANYSSRDFLNDTFMDPISESDIIFTLNQIFELNPYNFTITMGIEIDCEDNYGGYELDKWYSLLIKSLNFTFSYEKKIDQFTTASWNQDGDQISDLGGDTIIINEAKLNFKYKINETWPGSSPNSEIRAYINNIKISETIKLSKANSTFQFAKSGGIEVTSLIPYNSKINFSIQVYIADEFNLDKKISLSIDDVYLNITYTVTFPNIQTNLQIFFNGDNKTLNPIYEHPVNQNLNITIKYPDNLGIHIPGAVVQLFGNLTGVLTENSTLGQYTIIINAIDLILGEFFFDVIAHRINYEARIIVPILIVTEVTTDNLQLFLNGENKTSDKSIDIALNKLLNITVKYNDIFGTHVPGATVELTGEGVFETLNENLSLRQYSIILNTTVKLSLGTNLLTINAQASDYSKSIINPRISIRQIYAKITPLSGSNTIRISPGGYAFVRIYINNTDFNINITGAIVTYTWDYDDGILTDLDQDGIYEGEFNNVPEGTHSVIINAFGSDIYNFESYEIIIAAVRLEGNALLFQILTIIAIVSAIMIGGYLYAYQKVLKFPKAVRKVRKYRKRLKRKNPPKISIKERKTIFKSVYQKEISKTSKFLKGKPRVEKSIIEKPFVKQNVVSKTKIGSKEKKIIPENSNLDKTPDKQLFEQKNFKNKLGNMIKKYRKSIKTFNNRFGTFFKVILLIILILGMPLIMQLSNRMIRNLAENSTFSKNSNEINNLGLAAQDSFTTQWLNNTTFDDPIQPVWFPILGVLGDDTDVNATTSLGQANFEVLGNYTTFNNVSGVPQPGDGWSPYNNSYFITPDYYEINDITGVMANHTYDENIDQSRNRPSIHWRLNVSMPVNMSEYIITSVNLSAIVNGSADTNVETPLDDLSTGGTSAWSYTYHDYARFYVKISNLNYEDLNEVAYYQTVNLGEGDQLHDGSGTLAPTLDDTFMNLIEKSRIIYYLTRALEYDNFNFGITLGIDIYTEDNYNDLDLDTFHSLLIKSFNLTFSYEKRMDIFTSVSWNQNADKISGLSNDTVIVDEALLNFNYTIDQDWVSSSPNSELRILINDNQHFETVKLSTANTSFQLAKSGGFDITSLITDDVNVSIQLYLADNFGLNRTITVSIDDVTLNISYTIIFPDIETNYQLILNNENRTLTPNFELIVGQQLNITIKYLNMTGNHVPNATVLLAGNFTGTLTENETLGQYSFIINTNVSNIGTNFLTITAQAVDHQLQKITPTITVNKIGTNDLQVFLNKEDMTLDPSIESIVGEELNVTIKYLDLMGIHVPNGTVRLISVGITKDLNESLIFEQYTVLVNTSDRMKIGSNLLTIEAQTSLLETKYAFISLYVRKINVDIVTLSGSNTIVTSVGKDITLQIKLNNTDLGGLIKGSIVTFSWEQASGILADPNNDGIYEITIPNLPLGDFTFTISGFAGDDYDIQDFDIFVISVAQEVEDPTLFIALFILAIILVSGLISYLVIYQRYLKYPKPVRKVRKYKKSLRKKNVPSIYIRGRESSFKSLYNENIGTFSKDLKLKHHSELIKPLTQKGTPDMVTTNSLETKIEQEQLTKKVIEKKYELDDLIKDFSKDSSK